MAINKFQFLVSCVIFTIVRLSIQFYFPLFKQVKANSNLIITIHRKGKQKSIEQIADIQETKLDMQLNKKQILKSSVQKAQQQGKRKIKDNFLTVQNNCEVIETTSEIIPNGEAHNIMTNSQRQVWVTQFAPPQYVIIDIQKMLLTPQSGVLNYVGFYCWYDYETNPALIEILIKDTTSSDSFDEGRQDRYATWITVAKIRLQMKVGWQQFRLANQIHLKNKGKNNFTQNAKLIKIQILQNFGDQNNTYLNQVSFGYVPDQSKQNTNIKLATEASALKKYSNFSQKQHLKTNQPAFKAMTSTEKQLKKANERISQLQKQQEKMRQAILSQNQVISQMQIQMQKLIGFTIQNESKKLKPEILNQENQVSYSQNLNIDHDQRQRTQSTHQKNQKYSYKQKTENNSKEEKRNLQGSNQRFKSKSGQLLNSKERLRQEYLRNPFIKKQHLDKSKENKIKLSNMRVASYDKHHQQSSQEDSGSDTQSLSEYSKSPKPNKKYISMLEKLQTLIAIRDEKKKQLKLKSDKKQKSMQNSKSKFIMSAYSRDSEIDY